MVIVYADVLLTDRKGRVIAGPHVVRLGDKDGVLAGSATFRLTRKVAEGLVRVEMEVPGLRLRKVSETRLTGGEGRVGDSVSVDLEFTIV